MKMPEQKPDTGLDATALALAKRALDASKRNQRGLRWLATLFIWNKGPRGRRGKPGKKGRPPTDSEIASAVSSYLTEHPPEPGENGRAPTAKEIAAAVRVYLVANPPKPGKDGKPPTATELAKLVSGHIKKHPPKAGKPGKNGRPPTSREIRREVRAELKANPPKGGGQGKPGPIGPMPKHQWKGTRLRFERSPDVWGKWTDLEGQPGPATGGGGRASAAAKAYSEALTGLSHTIPKESHGIQLVTSVIAIKADGSEVSLCWKDNAGDIEFDSLIPMDGLVARIS